MAFQRVTETGDAGVYAWQDLTSANSSWCGYLLRQGAGAASTLTAEEAWSGYWGVPIQQLNGGIYLFCRSVPTDYPGLLARLSTYVEGLNQASQSGFRYVMWLENPNAADTLRGQQIPFVRGSSDMAGQVPVAASLKFRNIVFQIATGVSVTGDSTVPSLQLLPFGSASTLQFINTLGTPKVFGAVQSAATVGIGGTSGGRLEMRLRIRASDSVLQNDLVTMRTGVQYFYQRPKPISPQPEDTSFGDGATELVGMLNPVLDSTAAGNAMLRVWLDPIEHLDVERTAFLFVDDAGGSPPSFVSYFVSDAGATVTLLPASGSAGFVLSEEMYPLSFLNPGTQQTPTYYFTQVGSFELSSSAPAGNVNLLCGLAATETIGFVTGGTPAQTSLLTFFPRQPAFAPQYPLLAINLNEPNSPPPLPQLLTASYTTCWATVTPKPVPTPDDPVAGNTFYSQPHGAALFGNVGLADAAGADKDGPPSLGFFQTRLADLGTATAAQSFPLTPYRGSRLFWNADSAGLPGPFETAIVSPTRKVAVTSIVAAAGTTTPVTAGTADRKLTTTPQGLLAEIGTDRAARWQSILLGTNVDRGKTYKLEFRNIDTDLQSAFQTSQQFLVITKPKKPWNVAGDTTFDNLMSVEGWPFRIRSMQDAAPGDYSNVMIFKFLPGRISDLVKNPSNWTSADQFNDAGPQGLALVSQWLQDYIANARSMAGSSGSSQASYFENFLELVDSETWNGILMLKTDVEVSAFPAELRGLLGGIDLTSFNAHHLGVNVNFVQVDAAGAPQISGNSSIFGLIYYVDAAYQAQLALGANPDRPIAVAPGPYGFSVLTLKVLFENTAIRSFECRVQLTINQFFGESVLGIVEPAGLPLNLPSNSILLDGAYEDHGGQSAFTLGSKTSRLFLLNSNVLGTVEAVQTTYATLTPTTGSASDMVHARFSIAGYMNFKPVTDLDVFSFGSDWIDGKPGNSQGLYFSNLFLDVSFPGATPTQTTFSFITSDLTLNVVQSTSRRMSLYANFPLKLDSLLEGTASATPAKAGYLGMKLPKEVTLTGVKGAWHGLRFQLDMGTVGALADNAGLVSYLLASWSPGSGGTTGTYDASVGIQLPGTGGVGKLLSIQGVLKLSIGDGELLLGETSDKRPAYMLKIGKIALKFLIFSFPPNGNTVFFLFGDPQPEAPQTTMGWYAAYTKKSSAAPPRTIEGERVEGERSRELSAALSEIDGG